MVYVCIGVLDYLLVSLSLLVNVVQCVDTLRHDTVSVLAVGSIAVNIGFVIYRTRHEEVLHSQYEHFFMSGSTGTQDTVLQDGSEGCAEDRIASFLYDLQA